MIHFIQRKLRWKRSFILHQDTAYLISYNLFTFQLPELWKSKYFNKLAQEHCSVLDTSASLMLRSNPAPASSYPAVCTSSHRSLFQCHFFAWGNIIMDGEEMHQQLPAHYLDSFYFVSSQGQRTGIGLYKIIKYWGMKRDAALCILCSEVTTASLEGTALEKLYKRKGIACLQCLKRLTWCFPLAVQSLPC